MNISYTPNFELYKNGLYIFFQINYLFCKQLYDQVTQTHTDTIFLKSKFT